MSLGKVYYDPKHAAGYGSVANPVTGSKTKRRDLEDWLSGQNTNTLHRLFVKRFLVIRIL